MPPPLVPPPPPTRQLASRLTDQMERPPLIRCPTSGNSPDQMTQHAPRHQDVASAPESENTWMTASRKGRNRRRKDATLAHKQSQGMHGAVNLVPGSFSYANVARQATNLTQPTPSGTTASAARNQSGMASQKPLADMVALPSIMEITIIHQGGHGDHQAEMRIRARAADAIVREVRLNMAKAVANPIPLRAGRWSVHPRSKGNFVFSFNGHIPFDIISSYEHLLLEPFQGTGQLCPSLGWT